MNDRFPDNIKALRTDCLIALALVFAIFLLGYINLDNNCNWGDDFAAYMADGIALAEGRYEEQIKLNVILRSGRLLDEQTEHVHVFGFPLLHALTYSLAGFDTVDYSNLYLYKIPSLIAFSLMAGIYFLFLRKRLGVSLSLLMTLALCADPTLHYEIRNLYSDILFLALSISSFYVMEQYLEMPYGKKRLLCAGFLGLILWYTYSVRLNGIVSAFCVLLAQLLWLIKEKKKSSLTELIPAATFLLLFVLFNLIIFRWPTSTSSAGDVTVEGFFRGCVYYLDMLHMWARHFAEILLEIPVKLGATALYSIFDAPEVCAIISRAENFMYVQVFDFLALIFLLLSLVGIIAVGLKKDLHIVLFLFVSFIGTAALSLGQELRYLHVLLPFLLMYSALGGKWLIERFGKKGDKPRRQKSFLKTAVTALICIFSVLPLLDAGIVNLKNNAQENLTAYSDGAIEVYNYIQNELDAEDTIAFFKPRALYLNTGHVSLLPQEDGFKISDADYYLYYIPSEELLITKELESIYQPCFENYEFILYEKLDT